MLECANAESLERRADENGFGLSNLDINETDEIESNQNPKKPSMVSKAKKQKKQSSPIIRRIRKP